MRALSVIIAAAAALVFAPAANAEGNDVVEIKNVKSGTCLTLGQHFVEMAACTGAAGQKWELVPVDGKYVLRDLATRDCVRSNSEYVTPADCAADVDGQLAELVSDGTAVKLKYGERFVQASGYRDNVNAVHPENSDKQRWQLRVLDETAPPLDDTTGKVVRIKNHLTDECVSATGTTVNVCEPTAEQTFQRVELGDGRFKLQAVTTGLCLGKTGSGYEQWAEWAEWAECAATDPAQEWLLETDALGAHAIRHAQGGDWSYLVPTNDRRLGLFVNWSGDDWYKWEITLA